MLTKFRLVLISLLASATLVACNSTDDSSIKAGQSEQSVTELLGVPTFSQSRSIDALTFTQSEWTTEEGTTSVQFQNGQVQYHQYSPK